MGPMCRLHLCYQKIINNYKFAILQDLKRRRRQFFSMLTCSGKLSKGVQFDGYNYAGPEDTSL